MFQLPLLKTDNFVKLYDTLYSDTSINTHEKLYNVVQNNKRGMEN